MPSYNNFRNTENDKESSQRKHLNSSHPYHHRIGTHNHSLSLNSYTFLFVMSRECDFLFPFTSFTDTLYSTQTISALKHPTLIIIQIEDIHSTCRIRFVFNPESVYVYDFFFWVTWTENMNVMYSWTNTRNTRYIRVDRYVCTSIYLTVYVFVLYFIAKGTKEITY